MSNVRALLQAVLLSALLAGCAIDPTGAGLVADPLEDINRSIHEVNKGLDRAVLRPAADVYDVATPTLFKHVFGNAVRHLTLPGTFVNYVLQGDTDEAVATLGRFTLNTVYGAGGALDPATEFGLPLAPTDFGLTLASWGVDEGPYVELPLFGPSTARDTVGLLVDTALQPTTYVTGGVEITIASATVRALDIVDRRNRNKGLIDDVLYRSEDSYVSLRTAYIQNRRKRASGGETNVDDLPDLFEED
ncbi:MAG: VacJ family lipoprotein [Pseudomonadota bacterium]